MEWVLLILLVIVFPGITIALFRGAVTVTRFVVIAGLGLIVITDFLGLLL